MNSDPSAGKPAILACFAMKEESAAFGRIAGSRPEIRVLLTGIGRRNAERRTREFLEGTTPALILSCGFAGGLDPAIEAGAVLVETADPALLRGFIEAGARPGKFCCSARIAASALEKSELRRATGADAVEMESEAICAVSVERGIACATVRVISDVAGEDLPLDFNQLAKADMSLDYGKLAVSIALAPWKIPALMRLQRQTGAAAEALAGVLGKFLEISR